MLCLKLDHVSYSIGLLVKSQLLVCEEVNPANSVLQVVQFYEDTLTEWLGESSRLDLPQIPGLILQENSNRQK